MDAMEAARERANEIATAAIPGGGEAGLVTNATGVLALHMGVDRDLMAAFLKRRSETLLELLNAHLAVASAAGADEFDVAPLFAGALGQAFLMGWLVRDEQEKRG